MSRGGFMGLSNEKLVELIQSNVFTVEHLQALYNQNKSLMIAIIQRTLKGGASIELMDELLQECYIILCDCVKKYDLKQSVKFSSFFSTAIKWGIYKYTALNGLKIKVPGYMISKVHKYKKLCVAGETERNIIKILDINAAELDTIKQVANSSVISLDTPLNADEGKNIAFGDTLVDESSAFEDNVINRVDDKILYNLCKSILKPDEFKVIKLRYWGNIPYKDIAKVTVKKYSQLRTIEYRALQKLRRSQRIRDYYEPYLYRHTGLNKFNRTHTSSVEEYVLRKLDIELLTGIV